MAMFEPMREGFRELNRMLTDRQQFNAQHEADRAAREQAHEMNMGRLQNQMENQEFNRQMDKARLAIAQAGDARAERVFAFNQMDSNRKHELAVQEAERTGNWNNERIAASKQGRMQGMAAAQKSMQQVTPGPSQVGNFVRPEVLTNPDAAAEMNQLMANEGVAVNSEGQFVDPNTGQQKFLSPVKQNQYAHMWSGLDAKYGNNRAEKMTNIANLESAIKEQTSIIKNDGNQYKHNEVAQAKHKRNQLKGQLAEENKYFSTEVQMAEAEGNIVRLTQAAGSYRMMGNEDAARGMEKEIARNRDIIEGLMKSEAGGSAEGLNMVQLYKPELDKEGRAEGAGKATYDKMTGDWLVEGENVGPSLAAYNLTAVKPTESYDPRGGAGGAGGGVPGQMTEEQMLNVKKYYEAEGMLAGITADAMKPKLAVVRSAIAHRYGRLGKDPAARAQIQIETIADIDAMETDYQTDMDELAKTSQKSIEKTLNSMGIKPVKGKTRRQQLADVVFFEFRDDMRETLKMPLLRVYRPNKSTRKQTLGERM